MLKAGPKRINMKLKTWYPTNLNSTKGYTLIEALISLGLIFMIVFAVSALALGFSRYQAARLERSLVQENFRYTVSIISEEVQEKSFGDIWEPFRGMSSELYLVEGTNYEDITVIRYHVFKNETSIESQVFRKEYHHANITNWVNWRNDVDNKTPDEDEPVSDKIKAISHLLFTDSEGLAIFITGETSDKKKVTYLSLVFPRN